LARFVCSYTISRCFSMTLHDAATPGVYQIEKSLGSRIGHFGMTCTFPLYKGCRRRASSDGLVATEIRSCTEDINRLLSRRYEEPPSRIRSLSFMISL
jgi:hypothetical protein